MKRFLVFISLHLFLFLLGFASHAQADDEEWTIDKYKSLSYARVSGEVIHGDNLNFFIGSHENCEKDYNSFTFVTYEKPCDIQQHYNLTPAPFKKIASSSKGHLGLAG